MIALLKNWKLLALAAGVLSYIALIGIAYNIGGNSREAKLRQAAAEERAESIGAAREIENEVKTDDDLRDYFDQRLQRAE